MVSVLEENKNNYYVCIFLGSSGPGSSPGRGHCVVFLDKTLYSDSASLHPGVQISISELNAGGNPAKD